MIYLTNILIETFDWYIIDKLDNDALFSYLFFNSDILLINFINDAIVYITDALHLYTIYKLDNHALVYIAKAFDKLDNYAILYTYETLSI